MDELLKSEIGGGARRDRTADLVNAIHALSQLSYGPKLFVRTTSLSQNEINKTPISDFELAHRSRVKFFQI